MGSGQRRDRVQYRWHRREHADCERVRRMHHGHGVVHDERSVGTRGIGERFGSVTMGNATSGTVTIQPVGGALGSVTLLVPAANATLATTASINTALPSATSSQLYVGTGAAGVAAAASVLPTAAVPAFSGDATNSAGSLTTVVAHVNGVAYGSGPATNTVPVVTGSNAVTYEAVPNAALANSTISSVALGSNLATFTMGAHMTAGSASYNGSGAATLTSDATNANTASTIVARDGSGTSPLARSPRH